jgi:hypothetical protein
MSDRPSGLIINREAPVTKLRTMGQGDKEMPKEVSYESNPELYHFRPGTTEPELINPLPSPPSTAGTDVIKKEPASKGGAVGAKTETSPKAARKK